MLPGKLHPVLEETGLIHEVGRWALYRAIRGLLALAALRLASVPIAVNVSALQLRSRTFIDEVKGALAVDAAAAAGLELEITESVIMGNVRQSGRACKRCGPWV